MKIELSRPIKYRENELSELEIDLERLTGYELLDAEEELRRQGITVSVWDYSRPFMIQLASRAMHIPVEILKGMNAMDFMKVCNVVSGFLLGVDTEALTRISTERQ